MHIRNTLAMALILVVLAGFVYFYEIRGRAEREEAEQAASRLVSFEPETVERITLQLPDERVVIDKAADGWTIAEPSGIAADDAAIDALVDSLGRAEKDRLIAESPDDPAAFGLDAPDVTVTLALSGGEERRVAIGKDTPIGANLYVMVGDEIYSARQGLRSDLALSLYDLRDRSLLEFEEAEVTRLELRTPDLEGGAVRTEGSDDDWQLTFPLSGRADADTIDDLLSEVYTSEAEAFVHDGVPSPEQMQEYGLVDPERVVTVWTGDDAARRLLIGAASEEPNGYYGMRDGGNAVFVVATDLVESLPSSADELRNHQVLTLARERVRGIAIDRDGTTLRVERSGSDWSVTEPRELAADPSGVSRLLSALQDLRALSFADEAPDSDPALTVRLEIGGADGAEPAERREIRVGARTEATDEEGATVDARYVTVSGDDSVYVVEDTSLDPLRAEVFDLRDKTIVEFSEPDVTRIELTTADGATRELTRDGDAWQAVDGVSEELDASLVDDVLWEVNYLRMSAVAGEWSGGAPDLGEFGLDSPRFELRILADDEVVAALQVGASSGDDVWVMQPQGEAVYVVGGSLVNALDALSDAIGSP